MVRSFVVLLALCFLVTSLSVAQDARFLSRTFRSPSSGEVLPYRLFVPQGAGAASGKRFPLVLWLHGIKGRGNDNAAQISGENAVGSLFWARDSVQRDYPCFVMAPQCPDTALWVANDGIDAPPDELDLAVAALSDVARHYPLDTTRIYAVGQSMGGVAVWEVATRYPSKFAAVMPLCGIGNPRKAGTLATMAIWTFHGSADSTIPVKRTRDMVAAIKKAGGAPRFSEYPGVGHDVWHVAFKEPGLAAWLFRQKR